jgi:hypothetical protein
MDGKTCGALYRGVGTTIIAICWPVGMDSETPKKVVLGMCYASQVFEFSFPSSRQPTVHGKEKTRRKSNSFKVLFSLDG